MKWTLDDVERAEKFLKAIEEAESQYYCSVCIGCGCCGAGYSTQIGKYWDDFTPKILTNIKRSLKRKNK